MEVASSICSSILNEVVSVSPFNAWEIKNDQKEKCQKHRHAIHARVTFWGGLDWARH